MISLLVLLLLVFIILYPFIWMVVTSFKAEADIVSWPPKLFSGEFGLQSYKDIWERIPFLTYYRNTIIFALSVSLISLTFDTMAGYAFARIDFKGKNIMFLLVMGTLMVPFQVIMVPLFVEVYKMNLINTYLGMILPKGLEEAGRIDGAGEFKIFRKIMLPQCKAAVISLFIFHFMYQWNDLLYPLIMTTDDSHKTLPAGIASFMGTHVVEYGVIMAGACLSILPILIVYLFAQKQFVQGIAMSGMKG